VVRVREGEERGREYEVCLNDPGAGRRLIGIGV